MNYTFQQRLHHIEVMLTLSSSEASLSKAQKALAMVIRENGWEPSREPALTVVRNTPLSTVYKCRIDLFPKVKLPQNLHIAHEAPPMVFPHEDEVLERIQALQIRFGDIQSVDRGARWGDILCLNWFGVCEGQLLPQSARSRFFMLLHKSSWASPLAAKLLGTRAGEVRQVKQALPLDYSHPAWQGKTVDYMVYIDHVQEANVPPANEQLAQISGIAPDFEGLLAHLHDQLRAEKQTQWHEQLTRELLHQVIEKSLVQVPDYWVQDTLKASWEYSDKTCLETLQGSLPLAKQMCETGFDTWKTHCYLYKEHEQNLKKQLVLREIAREHKLGVSDTEITQTLDAVGQPLHLPHNLVWGALVKDGQEQRFLNQLTLNKAARWLVKQARITHQGELLETF